MTRKTLQKYSTRKLLDRIVRLARMPDTRDTEIEINNAIGVVEDRTFNH